MHNAYKNIVAAAFAASIAYTSGPCQSVNMATSLPSNVGSFLNYAGTAQDSMEFVLLDAARNQQQIEQLLKSLPMGCRSLDLLPSVLPVSMPAESFLITSPFGIRQHPINQDHRFHGGIDIKASEGTAVKATADGIVKEVGKHPNLGVFVRLQHAFGFESTYGHLSGMCVRPGEEVLRNQEIGRVGRTGLATGPHLHYAIRKHGAVLDPHYFCFLLRRRIGIYEEKSKASGVAASEGVKCCSSRGE
jgi:murein DD-endopeptidase MepM/ murein hydrolase activator NlpD